jgi:hypothetical protein
MIEYVDISSGVSLMFLQEFVRHLAILKQFLDIDHRLEAVNVDDYF